MTKDSQTDPQKESNHENKVKELDFPILNLLSLKTEITSDETLEQVEEKQEIQKKAYHLKIILLGEGAVGKTSLRLKFMGKTTGDTYLQTLGADFSVKRLPVSEIGREESTLQIWDIGGQIRFRDVVKGYFSGSNGAVVVYDITRPETFDEIPYWINHLWSITGPIPFTLIANKVDLSPSTKKSSTKHFRKLVRSLSSKTKKDYGFSIKGFFTSAITGENVNKAFLWLTREILTSNL
ncbi:MAG: Rab family GTPase [Candidatus Hodarchaeales archaeon]